MTLPITRVDTHDLGDYPAVERFSEGVERVKTKSYWHELPGTKDIMVKRETWVVNQYGTVIQYTIETWDYESSYAPPLEHLKLTYAALWLPGRARRSGIKLVDRQRTVFWSDSVYAATTSDERSYRTVREGIVLYRRAKEAKSRSAEELEQLVEQGRTLEADYGDEDEIEGGVGDGGPDPVPADHADDLLVDSVQTWEQALERSTIIEKEDTPTRCVWKTISIKDYRIEEDWSHIIKWSVKKDCIRPGLVDFSGPEYVKKVGVKEEIVVPLDPPTIESANVSGDQINLSVVGGGAVVNLTYPRDLKVPIRPQRYKLYRRVVSRPGRTQPDDLYGIYETDPSAADRLKPKITEDNVETVDGVPTSSLPSTTTDVEPAAEDPTPEPVVQWSMVGEVENDVLDKYADGHGAFEDTGLENSAVYEYVATCLVADTESPYSEPIQIEFTGATDTTGLGVDIIEGDDGYIEVEILSPDDIELFDALGDFGPDMADYGETVIYDDVPLGLDYDDGAVDDDGELKDWRAQLEDMARQIGLANIIRDNGLRQIQFTPTIPLLTLARGQYVELPTIGWKTVGNSLVIDSETISTTVRVDGFTYTFSAKDGSFEARPGPVTGSVVDL